MFVLVLVPLVQCFAWSARAMYLYARACILVQCFVMGNPSHVRILVFRLSRCTCSATPNDMDSLLVMSRDDFYIRCICAGCLYLTCRGAIVRLPVCTADREGGWQPRLIYTMYIIHHVYIYYIYKIKNKISLTGIRTHVPTCPESNMLPLSYCGEGLYFIFCFFL